jgi:ADP-heptose:LPS heptosyltransferase
MNKPVETNSDVKVIAIKLPFDLQERILCFPFLHAISEFYPKADLHFITPKLEVEVLNLLPFKAFYHLYEDDEFKTVMDVHPFTANARIYNVDIFISLTNSFVDACIGLGLRAKKRVGFSDNWKTLVLTDKIPRSFGHHISEDFTEIFQLTTGTVPDKRLKVTSRVLNRIIEDQTPYIAINLSPLRGDGIEDEWVELVSQFEGQKIVFFASDEIIKIQMVMEAFLARLPKKNTYVNFIHHDWIELGRMFAFSQGVITFSGAAGALAAYVGAKPVILYESEDPQKTGPFYFLADVAIMGVNNPGIIHTTTNDKVLKDRVTFNMNEVFAKAHEFFGL